MVGVATIAVGAAAMGRCPAYGAKCDCNRYQKLHFDFLNFGLVAACPRTSTAGRIRRAVEFALKYTFLGANRYIGEAEQCGLLADANRLRLDARSQLESSIDRRNCSI